MAVFAAWVMQGGLRSSRGGPRASGDAGGHSGRAAPVGDGAADLIERVMRAHCRRDAGRVARTRRWLFAAAADASVAAWPEGSRWPLDRVERLRSWAERDAPCEPTD